MHAQSPFSSYFLHEFTGVKTLFVTPKPHSDRNQTDYISLLYQDFTRNLEQSVLQVHYLSVFTFWKLIFTSTPSKKVLHVHWLESQTVKNLFGNLFKWISIQIYHSRGGTIIWTVHNLHPHRGRWLGLNLAMARRMGHLSDHILVHCHEVVSQIIHSYGVSNEKIRIVPHPEYPLERLSRTEALSILESTLKATFTEGIPTFLFYGQISAYKQIPQTVERIMKENLHCQILVAGRIMSDGKNDAAVLERLAEKNPSITLFFKSLSDPETQALFSISDAVILNYRAILDSGVFHLARSLRTPIIARSMGCFKEWSHHPDVYLFDTDDECLDHIRKWSTAIL